MVKNIINNSIELTEASLNMMAGDITWSVISKKYNGGLYLCLEFSLKGNEFINIVGQLYDKYNDSLDMVDDVMYVENALIEKAPVFLATYGLSTLVENVGKAGMKMIFVVDVDKEVDYLTDLNIRNLSQN